MWNGNWLADVRAGWRAYLQAPLHSTLAAFVVALGVASAGTMYAVSLAVSATVPPIPDPGRVARLYVADPSLPLGRRMPDSAESAVLIGRTAGMGTATRIDSGSARLSIDGCTALPTPVQVARVDEAFFDVIRVRPIVGRIWTTEDLARSTPVVVTERLWRETCGTGATPAGHLVRIDGRPMALVGVMPEEFWLTNDDVEVWLPSTTQGADGSGDVFVRLADGVNVADLNRRLHEEPQGVALALTDPAFSRNFQALVGLAAPALLVLLVSCANAAAILIARASRRTRDLAVKVGLGATASRLVREALIEAAVVSGVAALIAMPLMWTATAGVRRELGAIAPGLGRLIVIDDRVVMAAVGAAAIAALLTGLLPAVRASRADVAPLLSRVPRRSLVRRGHYSVADFLVVVQVALGVVLIVVTALFIGVFDAVSSRPAGRDPDGVVAASLDVSGARRVDGPVMTRVADALRAMPGVNRVAFSDSLPAPRRRSTRIGTQGDGAAPCIGTVRKVTPEYFAVLGLSIRAGHVFDAGTQDVAVASASLVAACWNGQAIGRRITIGTSDAARVLDVVGVVDDATPSEGLSEMRPFDLYVPYLPVDAGSAMVLVAAPTNVAGVSRGASEVVRRVSGGRLTLDAPATLRALTEGLVRSGRVLTGMLRSVGLVAWLLATVGLYSSIAQALTARWRDFGIRSALGARPWSLVAMTVGRHLPLFLAGTTAGIIVTIAVTSIVWADAVRVGGAGSRTWVTVIGTLALSALAASAGPALRVSRLDPMSALRREDE
jgi:predicted permease